MALLSRNWTGEQTEAQLDFSANSGDKPGTYQTYHLDSCVLRGLVRERIAFLHEAGGRRAEDGKSASSAVMSVGLGCLQIRRATAKQS